MVETDDFANCWFQFANGVRGQWCVSRVTPPFAEYGYVEVIGTEGALKAALSRGRIDVLKSSRPADPAVAESCRCRPRRKTTPSMRSPA